jgi:hypothetical protein
MQRHLPHRLEFTVAQSRAPPDCGYLIEEYQITS